MENSVLIVEHETPIARVLQLKLEKIGFTAEIARDGKEALASLEKKQPSLIVLELILPNLDGFLFIENVRKQGSTIPIVVYSDLAQPEDQKRAMELGATHYKIKSQTPFVTMVGFIQELLKSSTA